MSFLEHFRLAVRNQLGFETFHPESLDDHVEVYAFLIPKGIDEEESNCLKDFLSAFFLLHSRQTIKASFYSMGSYMYNWCGSRHITAHLEEHLLFYVEPCISQNCMDTVKKPTCIPWLVVEVDYDHVYADLSPDSRTRFDASIFAGVRTGEYHQVLERLRLQVRNEMSNRI